MSLDRFDRIGSEGLPEKIKETLSRLSRFNHLEIGKAEHSQEFQPPVAGRTCRSCGQFNENERDVCWACCERLNAPAPSSGEKTLREAQTQVVRVMIDGVAYASSDPDLPGDVRVLMDRIKAEGSSEKIIEDFKEWRRKGIVPTPYEITPDKTNPSENVQVFKGPKGSVVRIDGRVFCSDDKNLPPELKELFTYIEINGVTPALLEFLRESCKKVELRPGRAISPAEGELGSGRRTGLYDALLERDNAIAQQPSRRLSKAARQLFIFVVLWASVILAMNALARLGAQSLMERLMNFYELSRR